MDQETDAQWRARMERLQGTARRVLKNASDVVFARAMETVTLARASPGALIRVTIAEPDQLAIVSDITSFLIHFEMLDKSKGLVVGDEASTSLFCTNGSEIEFAFASNHQKR